MVTQQPVQDARGGTFFSRGRVVAASAVAACVLAAGGAAAAGGRDSRPDTLEPDDHGGRRGRRLADRRLAGGARVVRLGGRRPAPAGGAAQRGHVARHRRVRAGDARRDEGRRDRVRDGARLRLDVRSGAATSTLIGNEQGWTACQSESGAACVLVAGPGAALPAAFDPGIGALVTTTLPALADRKTGMIEADGWPPARSGPRPWPRRPASRSSGSRARSSASRAGLLRRARFIAGTLTLTSVSAAVDAAAFTAPAPAVPLA